MESDYKCARSYAQKQADKIGWDYGIEWNTIYKYWHTFPLPRRENRYGHEVKCEVIYSNNPKEGHGYNYKER